MSISPYSLSLDSVYSFQVLTTSPDGRYSSASVSITPADVGGVSVAITSTVTKINADSKLELSGLVYANFTGSVLVYAYWQTLLSGVVDSATPITSPSIYFTASQVSFNGIGSSFTLAFDVNTFLQGRVYTFR